MGEKERSVALLKSRMHGVDFKAPCNSTLAKKVMVLRFLKLKINFLMLLILCQMLTERK